MWWWWGVRAFNCVILLYFSDASAQAKTSSSSQKPAFNLLLLHGNCIKQSSPAKSASSHYLDQTQHHRKSTQYITPVTAFSFKPEGVIIFTFPPLPSFIHFAENRSLVARCSCPLEASTQFCRLLIKSVSILISLKRSLFIKVQHTCVAHEQEAQSAERKRKGAKLV